MQCLILAGGKGTRMPSFTTVIPKALIPVHGKPFLHYQLSQLSSSGVSDVVLSVGYLGELIKNFVGDGSRWSLRVRYVDEGKNLLGTGGAIRLAYDKSLLEDDFLVLYGDSYLKVDYGKLWEFYRMNQCRALMTVYKNENCFGQSNVHFQSPMVLKHNKKEHDSKMEYIDYGLSIFNKQLFSSYVPSNAVYDLAELTAMLSAKNELWGFEIHDRFYEIGSPDGLKDFEAYLLK